MGCRACDPPGPLIRVVVNATGAFDDPNRPADDASGSLRGHLLAGAEKEVPVTHAKIFGWYDNEYGSYTNLLGDLTVHVHRTLE